MSTGRFFLAAMALVCAASLLPVAAKAAPAWGEIREATRNLNVREFRDHTSRRIITLEQGEQVKVDFLAEGWFAVFPLDAADRDEALSIGYSKADFLSFVSKAPSVAEKNVLDVAAAGPGTPTGGNETEEAPGNTVRAPAVQTPVDPEAEQGQKVVAEVEQRPEDVPPPSSASGKPPVRITADKLTYDDRQRTVVFSGQVEAEHEGLHLWASELTAYFSKDGSPGEEIDRIVASGGVRVMRQDTEGTCERVTYHVQQAILLMEGKPVIREGKNTVTGKVIKFYVRENRSEVVGGNGDRVEAILFTPETLEAP